MNLKFKRKVYNKRKNMKQYMKKLSNFKFKKSKKKK